MFFCHFSYVNMKCMCACIRSNYDCKWPQILHKRANHWAQSFESQNIIYFPFCHEVLCVWLLFCQLYYITFCVPSADFNTKIMEQTSAAVSTPTSRGSREVVITCQYQQSPLWRHVDSNLAACLPATGTLQPVSQSVSQWGPLLQTVMSRPDSHYLTPRAAESQVGLSVGGRCDWDGCPASQSANQSINQCGANLWFEESKEQHMVVQTGKQSAKEKKGKQANWGWEQQRPRMFLGFDLFANKIVISSSFLFLSSSHPCSLISCCVGSLIRISAAPIFHCHPANTHTATTCQILMNYWKKTPFIIWL